MISLFRNWTRIRVVAFGNSLVVQWLGLWAFTAKAMGSIPGRGTKIPEAAWCGQKKKKKKNCCLQHAYTHGPIGMQGLLHMCTCSIWLSVSIYCSSTYSLRKGAETGLESGYKEWKNIGKISLFRISWRSDPTTKNWGFVVVWSPLIKRGKRYHLFLLILSLPDPPHLLSS